MPAVAPELSIQPLLVAASDAAGGADRAAFRLHQALCDAGTPSRMLVRSRHTDDAAVIGPQNQAGHLYAKVRARLGSQLSRLQTAANAAPHSFNILPSRWAQRIAALAPDIVHLHGVGGETLSITDIGRIAGPCVWTLHDSWAVNGAEHVPASLSDERWLHGYPPQGKGLDLDGWTWRRKRRAWQGGSKAPMHIIAPSHWLADRVRRSPLMQGWPLTVVPNLLSTAVYCPQPRVQARARFALPVDVPLLLFGALSPLSAGFKGWDLLVPALRRVAAQRGDVQAAVFGQSAPARPPQVGMPLHFIGELFDDESLALAYSAADVMVVPSRIENLPQTGTEAQACGTPVVAFDCAGLPDVVEQGVTGVLVPPYSTDALADAICGVLADEPRRRAMASAARARALALWSPEVVLPQLLAVYALAIGRNC